MTKPYWADWVGDDYPNTSLVIGATKHHYCSFASVQHSDGKWIAHHEGEPLLPAFSAHFDSQNAAKVALLERLIEHHSAIVEALRAELRNTEEL